MQDPWQNELCLAWADAFQKLAIFSKIKLDLVGCLFTFISAIRATMVRQLRWVILAMKALKGVAG